LNESFANVLFVLTSATYVVASAIFLRFLIRGKGDVGTLGPRLIALGALLHAAHIVVASARWRAFTSR
jgi:hypothetical protein